MKESFVFYRSFYEAIKDLKTKDKLLVYEAICELSLNQKELKLTGMSATIFKLIRPQILANYERYENGKKGGAPIGNQNARKNNKNNQWSFSKTTKKQPNVNVNDNVNVNVNDNVVVVEDNKTTGQQPQQPTFDELRSYCIENDMEDLDYEYVFKYYEDNNWVDANGNKVKNWKLRVRTWYKNDKKNGKLIKHQDTSRRLG